MREDALQFFSNRRRLACVEEAFWTSFIFRGFNMGLAAAVAFARPA